MSSPSAAAEALWGDIFENFRQFMARSDELRARITEVSKGAEPSEGLVCADQLKALNRSKQCAEATVRLLLMAAYFTANYRNCTHRERRSVDPSVLDTSSAAYQQLKAQLDEEEEEELARQRLLLGRNGAAPAPAAGGGGGGGGGGQSIFGQAFAAKPAAAQASRAAPEPAASRKRARSSPADDLDSFKSYMLGAYKSLHGLNERLTIGVPMRSVNSSAALAGAHTLHRSELLKEVNEFLARFGLSPVDKRDELWRKDFLEGFLGIETRENNSGRPLMVMDTPERRAIVYKSTIRNVGELVKRILDE